jgi:hypothetical protein
LIPARGLRHAIAEKNISTIAILWCAGVFLLALVVTVLAPAQSWDGFFYHEPIVGYAIQNRGFSILNLPMDQAVQATNGYPKFCESVAIWFVIFTDKTLIELPNTLCVPGLVLSFYVLARRFTSRIPAMTWPALLILMPAAWTQMSASYIDLQVAFFLIAATHFSTRPQYRFSDALLATLAMALVMASKGSGLAWIPPVAAIAYGRLLYHNWGQKPAAIALIAGGIALIASIASLTLVRNWYAFHNPLWPLQIDKPQWGIAWHGLITLEQMSPNPPLSELAERAYSLPIGGVDDVVRRGYGYAIPWVIAPLGLCATLLALIAAILETLKLKQQSNAKNFVLVAIPAICAIKTSPSLEIARYNLHIVMTLMLAICWLMNRAARMRLNEAIMGASTALSIIPFFWMKSWLWAPKEELLDHFAHPFGQHAYMVNPTFDLLARNREQELHANDLTVYTQELVFVGTQWNFKFSNRVEFWPYESSDQFLAAIDKNPPKWITTGDKSELRRILESRSSQWQLVGSTTPFNGTVSFRRLQADNGIHRASNTPNAQTDRPL